MAVYWDAQRARWRWEFDAVVRGRRHRIRKRLPAGTTEREARRIDQAWTAQTFAELNSAEPVAPWITEALTVYLTERVPELRDAANTIRNLEHLAPHVEGLRLDKLGELSRTYAQQHDHLAPATVRQRLATLRSACRYAHKYHQLGKLDWIAQIAMPKVDNARTHFLDRAAVLRLARACTHRPTRALILMTFYTGSRPGELHRSRVIDGCLVLDKGKTDRPLVKPVGRRVAGYLRHWPLTLDYTRYSFYFRQARDRVGLSHLHFHDLRHSTASAVLAAGGSLAQVGEILDHTSAQSSKRYAHLALDAKRQLLARLWEKPGNFFPPPQRGKSSETAK